MTQIFSNPLATKAKIEDDRVLLGFEVGSGLPVYVLPHHLAIFGMTQKSGKTTALEALISRSGLKAIAFITKRGEGGFTNYHSLTPYYKPRADWQFVEGLVNVALGEKVKYEPGMRYAIMKVCRGRKDLKEIQLEARRLAKLDKSTFMRSVYEKLDEYLDIVIPELEKWTFTTKLSLTEGVNVMDLSGMRLETQHLVIASTIEYAFVNLDHVIVIIPEAWESIPQGRMTPVKWVAQQFIRKGAALGNYLFLDSQDIGGIDKTPLRQVDNWLMGRMKEAHEVERILKQLLGSKISAEEIQTLGLGHFYAALGNVVKKVYVLPVGVPEEVGVQVARGQRSAESVRDEFLKVKVMEENDLVWKEKYDELVRRTEEIRLRAFEEGQASLSKDVVDDNKFLSEAMKGLSKELANVKEEMSGLRASNEMLSKENHAFLKLKEAFAELMLVPTGNILQGNGGPQNVNLKHEELTFTVSHTEKTVDLSTENQQGQIMFVAINDLSREGFTENEVSSALLERGWNISHSSLAPQLASNLVKSGLMMKLEGTRPTRYRLPGKITVNVKKASSG